MPDTEDTAVGHEPDNSDPLEGADVGETRTVSETVEMHTVDFEPEVFWGTDRFGESEIAEVEIKTDDYGDEILAVTFEGEVTKALPRRWDYSREPLTEVQEKAQERKKWAKRALHAGIIVGTMALATIITNRVMEQMAGITIEGEPMQAPGAEGLAVVFGVLVIVAWAVHYLPGKVGGRSL